MPWNPNGPRRWPGQQPYPHRCIVCGELFTAVAPHAVLCSNRCAQRASRARRADQPIEDTRRDRECIECGIEFDALTVNGKVCSNPCKQRAIRRRKREARDRDRVTT